MQLIQYPLLKKSGWSCQKCVSAISDKLYLNGSSKKRYLLELFAGSATVSRIAKTEFKMKTFTLDLSPKTKPDLLKDIMKTSIRDIPDSRQISVVWASVPCECYSIEAINLHWYKYHITHRNYLYLPKSSRAIEALQLLDKTLWLIKQIKPTYWFVENPRGAMRHTPQMYYSPFRYTVSYNDYGTDCYKPTDIFTNFGAVKLKRLKGAVGKSFPGSIAKINNTAARAVVPAELIRSILSQVYPYPVANSKRAIV